MIYIDTNIFIYLFEGHNLYGEKVVESLEAYKLQNKQLVTSAITVTEFLTGTIKSKLMTLHQLSDLSILPLDENIAEQAAILQRENNIKIGDSIHLATALQAKAESFYTNDKELSKIVAKYIPITSI